MSGSGTPARPVDLSIEQGRIELVGFDARATLDDLAAAVEDTRRTPGLVTFACYGCGRCCAEPIPVLGLDLERTGTDLAYPARPDPGTRRKAIAALRSEHGFSFAEAALVHDHNNAEPITLPRYPGGECRRLQNGLCEDYQKRPFICRLYVCNMGERLEAVFQAIVALGTWDAYRRLGWIPDGELSDNPFVGRSSYAEVPLAGFEGELQTALERLFFYF